ncbi:MAG: hypothetical protein IK026_05380 [Eubacteriaceae bacterium]|nr:hypothetical protein [Eubacteriaceae bacterium]
MKDGRLESSFSLPRIEEENEISFADGAIDGITLYHTGMPKIDAAGTKLMIKAVMHAADGNTAEADSAFAELGKSFRAISILDELQNYILKHTDKLPATNIYQVALDLILSSADRESVKFGLCLLELFRSDLESVKEVVRRIGLSDEFTIFSVWNMLKWDDANMEIFDLIRKVHGWGRIHALERLEPETPEISEWILLNGIDNYVMPSYSALTVWRKAAVENRLYGKISREEFSAIGRIIGALLDEGPVPGISEIENAEKSILAYLSLADGFSLDIEDYKNILDLKNWAADEDVDLPAVSDRCAEIIASDKCRETVLRSVKTGNGIRIAEALGIDFADDLLECMKTDFDRHYHSCGNVIHREGYLDRVIDLFHNKLPLDQMRRDPAAELGLSAEYIHYNQLETLVYALGEHPCCGEDLVAAGLWSPVVRNRHTALRTLESWCRLLKRPLQEISKTLYQELSELIEKEVDDELKEKEQKLLDGYILSETGEGGFVK